MAFAAVCFSVFVVFCVTISTSAAQKLDVAVLYESLCPDSINFITQQLAPVLSDLAPYTTYKFVPFGKSYSINGGESFECQHGPSECAGNKVQSCALHLLTGDEVRQANFVVCQMKRGADPSGKTCSELANLSFNSVLQCVNSNIGVQLQLQAEKDTLSLTENGGYPSFVPTIVYQKVYNEQLQKQSLSDFKGAVCQFLEPRPLVCG